MYDHLDAAIPQGFVKRIHQALRAWHTQHTRDVLDDLLLAHQLQTQQEMAAPRLISNQVLLNGLDRLKQTDEAGRDLLQWRFLSQETAQELAYRQNVSEDVIFQRQRAAIAQLAQVIWSQEVELRQRRARKIKARLEPPTYTRLFGVAENMARLRAQLASGSEPWIIALEGLGGIGKTSLADALARELAGATCFYEIGWVSARRRLFRLSGDIQTLPQRPDLTLAELLDLLVEQFELTGLRRRSDAEKLAGMRDFLKSQPCLVIIDNLETVGDYDSLVAQLSRLAAPSKFLITTRHSLRHASGVHILTLEQLSRDDTLALVRHEAATRGLRELDGVPQEDLEPIYAITGGNPLAAKLIIGQIHTFSLPMALARFSAATGQPVENLLTFIYANAWQSLEQDSRRVLQAMLLATKEGGRLEQIASAAELDPDEAATCLQRLATLSLVNVGGDWRERRYSLHQLTQTFLAQQAREHSL